MQARVGRTGIRRTERIELLDGTVGVDHDERAGQQPKPLYRARLAEHELDELTE